MITVKCLSDYVHFSAPEKWAGDEDLLVCDGELLE